MPPIKKATAFPLYGEAVAFRIRFSFFNEDHTSKYFFCIAGT